MLDVQLDLTQPCSALTRQTGTALYGSAPRYDVWFMVEQPTLWGAKAADEVAAFKLLEARVPAGLLARRLLIRRPHMANETTNFWAAGVPAARAYTLYIAHTTARDPALYAFTLNTPDDIADIDVAAILRRDPAFDGQRQTEPLFAICVNAQRDPCCGTHGTPILDRLDSRGDVNAWGCTHIGGHRFAPTGIVFPEGVCYGHVESDELNLIVAAAARGAIYARKLRGRVCYDEPTQAAEHYLRAALDLDALDALQLEAQTKMSADQWMVTFHVRAQTVRHQLDIVRVDLGYALPNSCSAAPTKQFEYRLLHHTVS